MLRPKKPVPNTLIRGGQPIQNEDIFFNPIRRHPFGFQVNDLTNNLSAIKHSTFIT